MSIQRQFLDKDGLLTLVDELKGYIDINSILVKQYDTLALFPTIGNEKYIYIDRSTNKSYRWDDTNVKFYCVGNDYENIEVINGGSSSS